MLQILGTSVEILGKLEAVLEKKKILGRLRQGKGRFKVLNLRNTNILFILAISL